MKAVIAREQGSPDVLVVTDLPIPEPAPGQVRVKVIATSINPIDVKVRKANLPMTPAAFPAVLHTDFSGVVDALGAGVTRFKIGDEVFGFSGGFRGPTGDVAGALSEYALADASLTARKPTKLDFRQSAALPLVAVTAWRALFEKVTLTPTSRVLITGGAGGVGYMAVQLASMAGADVVAVTRSPESTALALEAGAKACIDLAQTTPEEVVRIYTNGKGFDVIFDTVGGEALDAAFKMIRPSGDVVTVVGAATHGLAPLYLKGANLHMVLVLTPIMFGIDKDSQGEILERIAQLADCGRLTPRLDPQHFALAEAADAHRKFEAGEANGKIIIDVTTQP
jgi:NADPH2:quinone reductase